MQSSCAMMAASFYKMKYSYLFVKMIKRRQFLLYSLTLPSNILIFHSVCLCYSSFFSITDDTKQSYHVPTTFAQVSARGQLRCWWRSFLTLHITMDQLTPSSPPSTCRGSGFPAHPAATQFRWVPPPLAYEGHNVVPRRIWWGPHVRVVISKRYFLLQCLKARCAEKKACFGLDRCPPLPSPLPACSWTTRCCLEFALAAVHSSSPFCAECLYRDPMSCKFRGLVSVNAWKLTF